MKKSTFIFVSLLLITFSRFVLAEDLYQVTLLRAHPGYMPQLIEEAKNHRSELKGELIIMRHSQGDHWDLMLLSPTNSEIKQTKSFKNLVDFQHDFMASSKTSWQEVKSQDQNAGLYHIEMFQAARGKYAQLLKQREMENDYYHATERAGNVIFETRYGSDTDIFTIGFYKDLKTFATDPDLPNEVFEKAATDAGFKSRSDIGFYLRQFLVSHQDTLATKVK